MWCGNVTNISVCVADANTNMTRGNQRDVDRKRAQARAGEAKTVKKGDPKKRNESDAKGKLESSL